MNPAKRPREGEEKVRELLRTAAKDHGTQESFCEKHGLKLGPFCNMLAGLAGVSKRYADLVGYEVVVVWRKKKVPS